jgi:hypothetical protein
LKMSSSDRIELSVDPGTWAPMDEDMVSLDPIEFHLEEEPYKDRIDSYQRKTGLTEAVQTGTGRLNGILLKNCNCSLPLYRLYIAISRERSTLALSKGPIDSACRYRGESSSWRASLGEGQPRPVAHTVF